MKNKRRKEKQKTIQVDKGRAKVQSKSSIKKKSK